jgi:allantoate deiminase
MNPNFQKTFVERIEALGKLSEEADKLTRPSFSPSMKAANELVGEWMRSAGMTIRQDTITNLIGRYEGESPKTLLIGSHIDTVRDAGKYDGTLGVLLGLACVEALEGKKLPFSIEVIAFCDEEGLRFHLSYLGSRAIVGALDEKHLGFADVDGITIAEAIRQNGGDVSRIPHEAKKSEDLLGYIEAHIEQGPVLESLDMPLGIVSGIAGQSRFEISFTGEAGHAGTVPMQLRKDALCVAARFVLLVQEEARNTEGLVATVGQLTVEPSASNAIPGKVVLSLDIRHQEDGVKNATIGRIKSSIENIAAIEHVAYSWTSISESPSLHCSPRLVKLLKETVTEVGYAPMMLSSGAGHDGVQISRLTEIAMLFVRCRAGISHNPLEYAAPSDIEIAADVLLRSILRLAENGRWSA